MDMDMMDTTPPSRRRQQAPGRVPAALIRSEAERTEYARRIYRAVRAEIPEYASSPAPGLDADFSDVNRQNVDLYFRTLAEDRPPHADELATLEHAAQRRLHQAFPLEALFHSYHIGVRVMWECLLEHTDGLDLGHLAILTLAYAERVTHAVANAYLDERERLARSHQEANRLFFTRLFSGDFDDEEAAVREARSLGYDLTLTHVVLLISPALPPSQANAQSDLEMAQVRNQLERTFPGCPAVLMRVGILCAVPGDSDSHILAALDAALRPPAQRATQLVVGLGTARAGVHGLLAGYAEAQHAQALGRILDPSRQIYRYDELRLFDLFKAGESVDAFIGEVLGRLVTYEHRRNAHLIETLDALFAVALNRKAAARRLGVHPNTLSYRITRIEDLIGGSLLSGEVCFRVQLALKLLPLSSIHGGHPGQSNEQQRRTPRQGDQRGR